MTDQYLTLARTAQIGKALRGAIGMIVKAEAEGMKPIRFEVSDLAHEAIKLDVLRETGRVVDDEQYMALCGYPYTVSGKGFGMALIACTEHQ